jgi:hypothetical protein
MIDAPSPTRHSPGNFTRLLISERSQVKYARSGRPREWTSDAERMRAQRARKRYQLTPEHDALVRQYIGNRVFSFPLLAQAWGSANARSTSANCKPSVIARSASRNWTTSMTRRPADLHAVMHERANQIRAADRGRAADRSCVCSFAAESRVREPMTTVPAPGHVAGSSAESRAQLGVSSRMAGCQGVPSLAGPAATQVRAPRIECAQQSA